jgi:carbonic anhydrase/acetyltransferase-like protein (isoleucine patch superfamily)
MIDPKRRDDLIDETAYVAANATVVGNVRIGTQSSVWFGAVVRGDTEEVTIGDRSNVQDLCVLHADPGFPCQIGDDVTIGHAAVIHGATVEDGAMIGIRAVVLNGAVISKGALVGAGAVVTEGTVIPPGHLAIGIPAKVFKELTPEQISRVTRAAKHYVEAASEYRNA